MWNCQTETVPGSSSGSWLAPPAGSFSNAVIAEWGRVPTETELDQFYKDKSQFFHHVLCVLSLSVMSNSLWYHGLQPARLPCPWNFPDNNTGVDCHPFSRDLPDPGSPALQVDSLPSEPPSPIKGTRGNSISFSAAQLLRVPKVHLKTTDEVPQGTSEDHRAYPNRAYGSKGDRQWVKKQVTNHRTSLVAQWLKCAF